MGTAAGTNCLQWTACFYVKNNGGEHADSFCFGPFDSHEYLASWRGKLLTRLHLLYPILSSRFILSLEYQEIRDYSDQELMTLPDNPEIFAEEYMEKYIGGHC